MAIIFATARTVQGWSTIIALIGIAGRFWNRDHPWRKMLTEAVFPFYIIHQTVIVGVEWMLLPLRLPAGAEFAILVAATFIGCWAFYLTGRGDRLAAAADRTAAAGGARAGLLVGAAFPRWRPDP